VDKREAIEVLKLPQGFSAKQLRDSYKSLVKIAHPDKGGSFIRFVEIQEALKVLEGLGGSIEPLVVDLLEIRLRHPISLKVSGYHKCSACRGTGWEGGPEHACKICKGSGRPKDRSSLKLFGPRCPCLKEEVCPSCVGSGLEGKETSITFVPTMSMVSQGFLAITSIRGKGGETISIPLSVDHQSAINIQGHLNLKVKLPYGGDPTKVSITTRNGIKEEPNLVLDSSGRMVVIIRGITFPVAPTFY
jgi:hypothetical protein